MNKLIALIMGLLLIGTSSAVAANHLQATKRQPASLPAEVKIKGPKAKALFEALLEKFGDFENREDCSMTWTSEYMNCSSTRCVVLGYEPGGKTKFYEVDRDPVVADFKAAGVKLKKSWTEGARFVAVSCSKDIDVEGKNCATPSDEVECRIEKVLPAN